MPMTFGDCYLPFVTILLTLTVSLNLWLNSLLPFWRKILPCIKLLLLPYRYFFHSLSGGKDQGIYFFFLLVLANCLSLSHLLCIFSFPFAYLFLFRFLSVKIGVQLSLEIMLAKLIAMQKEIPFWSLEVLPLIQRKLQQKTSRHCHHVPPSCFRL